MQNAHSSIQKINKALADKQHEIDFEQLNPRDLLKFSDKELALFQSNYPVGSPQGVLASHEWQRRLVVEQAKTSRFTALVGVLATILGAVVGHVLTKY